MGADDKSEPKGSLAAAVRRSVEKGEALRRDASDFSTEEARFVFNHRTARAAMERDGK